MAFAPIVVALIVGLFVGVLRRGTFRALARTRIGRPELLLVALVAGALTESTDIRGAGVITLVGLLAGLAFAAVNFHLVGMPIIAIGVAANLVPVAANGAMPVRADALVEAEMVDVDDLDRVRLTGARELVDDQTIAGFLGDTLPVRWTGQVLSIGDLIMLIGLADVTANLMLQRPRRRDRPAGLDLTAPEHQPDRLITTASPVHD